MESASGDQDVGSEVEVILRDDLLVGMRIASAATRRLRNSIVDMYLTTKLALNLPHKYLLVVRTLLRGNISSNNSATVSVVLLSCLPVITGKPTINMP